MDAAVNVQLVRLALEELSDENEQRRLWLSDGSGGKEVSSFVEAYCGLFDDSGLGDALEKGSLAFDEYVDSRLTRLDDLLRQLDSNRGPQEIIADPLMSDVRLLAADLLKKV